LTACRSSASTGGMDMRAIRRILLDLAGTATQPEAHLLESLDEDTWLRLDTMAEQHRLQPLLHSLHKEDPAIPDLIAGRWQAAHRRSAMESMLLKAGLEECCQLLVSHGFEPIALKGAYLAWHAYPDPALRPLRDLDLLLPRDNVADAFRLLERSGFAHLKTPDMPLEDIIRLEKHLTPLVTPRGTKLELHHRLWEPQGRLQYEVPRGIEDWVRENSIRIDGICFPAREDMLAHLIVHAVYSHRLDCGPLILTDILFLTRGGSFDWDSFWDRAKEENWHSGARLLIDLVRRYHGVDAVPRSGSEPEPPPVAIVDAAPDLLLQNLDTRGSASFIATLLTGGPSGIFKRIGGRRQATGEAGARRSLAKEGGPIRWATDRLKRTLGEAWNKDVRGQSRQIAELTRWLDR